jgi:hypothetical protein
MAIERFRYFVAVGERAQRRDPAFFRLIELGEVAGAGRLQYLSFAEGFHRQLWFERFGWSGRAAAVPFPVLECLNADP